MSVHHLRNVILNECLSYEKNVLSSVDTHTTQAQSIIHMLGFLIPLRKKAITRECRQQGKQRRDLLALLVELRGAL